METGLAELLRLAHEHGITTPSMWQLLGEAKDEIGYVLAGLAATYNMMRNVRRACGWARKTMRRGGASARLLTGVTCGVRRIVGRVRRGAARTLAPTQARPTAAARERLRAAPHSSAFFPVPRALPQKRRCAGPSVWRRRRAPHARRAATSSLRRDEAPPGDHAAPARDRPIGKCLDVRTPLRPPPRRRRGRWRHPGPRSHHSRAHRFIDRDAARCVDNEGIRPISVAVGPTLGAKARDDRSYRAFLDAVVDACRTPRAARLGVARCAIEEERDIERPRWVTITLTVWFDSADIAARLDAWRKMRGIVDEHTDPLRNGGDGPRMRDIDSRFFIVLGL